MQATFFVIQQINTNNSFMKINKLRKIILRSNGKIEMINKIVQIILKI